MKLIRVCISGCFLGLSISLKTSCSSLWPPANNTDFPLTIFITTYVVPFVIGILKHHEGLLLLVWSPNSLNQRTNCWTPTFSPPCWGPLWRLPPTYTLTCNSSICDVLHDYSCTIVHLWLRLFVHECWLYGSWDGDFDLCCSVLVIQTCDPDSVLVIQAVYSLTVYIITVCNSFSMLHQFLHLYTRYQATKNHQSDTYQSILMK